MRDKRHIEKNTEYKIGNISISIDELIRIIEELKFKTVRAENKNIEFESIDDIKSNKSLMIGHPSIICDNVRISFYRNFSRVSHSWGSEDDVSKVKSTAHELLHRKTILDKIIDRNLYVMLGFCCAFLLWYLLKQKVDYAELSELQKNIYSIFEGIYLILNVVFISYFIWGFYVNVMRPAIYYRPSEGFFRRNFDKMILTVTGAVCGAIVTLLVGKLFSQ
ncbi:MULTISPECIES: hypothetical protein [unclassified Mesorhizobium]|uniref:hypothetical protein n=1 Tax=unclassified Mesorhizobium TaxID=325217 RepID=UPI0030156EAA